MGTKFTRFYPDDFESMPFDVRDLRRALSWAEAHPGVRLEIKLDCLTIPELIEISPPGRLSPRWGIWRTHEGHLRVDDWARNQLGLPYQTVDTALEFISSTMKVVER